MEFLPGTLGEPNPYAEPPGLLQDEIINTEGKLEMGFSIGLPGERGSGSSGGLVTLTQGGVTRKGILTNYHVVVPLEPSPPEAKDMADSRGSSLLRDDDTQTTVQCFAGKDIDATREDIDWKVSSYTAIVHKSQEKQDRKLMAKGESSKSLEDTISRHQDAIELERNKKALFDQMPLTLGNTRFSSGKLLHDRRISDWAFVELTSESVSRFFGPNIIPSAAAL